MVSINFLCFHFRVCPKDFSVQCWARLSSQEKSEMDKTAEKVIDSARSSMIFSRGSPVVACVDRRTGQPHGKRCDFAFLQGDALQRDSLNQVLKGVERVFFCLPQVHLIKPLQILTPLLRCVSGSCSSHSALITSLPTLPLIWPRISF